MENCLFGSPMENCLFGSYMDHLEGEEFQCFEDFNTSAEDLAYKLKFTIASWVSILSISWDFYRHHFEELEGGGGLLIILFAGILVSLPLYLHP